MVLYALYTPKNESPCNRKRIYAFASVERFVGALNAVNKPRAKGGKLTPVTCEEAEKVTSIATLFSSADKYGVPSKEGEGVDVQTYSIRSTWDGTPMEIPLVEKITDEQVPVNHIYP